MTAGSRLAALGYVAGWKLVSRLPAGPVDRTARFAADRLAGRRGELGPGPAQLRRNLSRVLGCTPQEVPDALVRASLRSYARYWMEAFRLPQLTRGPKSAELVATLSEQIDGVAHLRRSLSAGRGVVLVLPHSGNWDMAGVLAVHLAGKFTTVNERLQPESLYDAFVDYRSSLGFEVLPLTGGAPPFATLRERLAGGGLVCLMGERDLRARGVEVEFFGEPTRMPAGAAQLARETGCALHVAHSWFTPIGWGFSCSEPLDAGRSLPAVVQDIANRFAANIAAHPADWHLLQPLWLRDLSQSHLDHIAAGR